MQTPLVPANILIVDDNHSFRLLLESYLKDDGYTVYSAVNGKEALELLARADIDLLLFDLALEEMDKVNLLREVQRCVLRFPVLVITAHENVKIAVEAMKEGVDGYLLKPINHDDLLLTINRHLNNHRLQQSCNRMERLFNDRFSFQNIKTNTSAMKVVLSAARQVATFPRITVVICGESGTGKKTLARAIHIASGCVPATFISVNCAAIPEQFLESELFGHIEGAFVGADSPRVGKCHRARGGTLFLDEVGDIPWALQKKLLRVLEEREFESVGSDQPQPAGFRLIAATSQDLQELSRQGRFHGDLCSLLRIFPLTLPPLRHHRADIPGLVDHFLKTIGHDQNKTPPKLSNAAMDLLMRHDWPGNNRELRNCLEYAMMINDGGPIQPEDFRLPLQTVSSADAVSGTITLHFAFSPEKFSFNAVTRQLLEWALRQTGNNKSAAARLLKISRKVFY